MIDANGALVLENLEIHDSGHMNVDQGWPAVYHSRSTSHSLTVRGCSFVDNGGDGPSHISYGGALQTNGNDVKIEDSTFSGNHSVSGAVRVWPSQLGQQPYSLIIRRTTFTDNHAKHGSGGGLNASGPSVVMEAVVFQDNSAPDGGRGGAAEIDISTNLSPITVALTDVDFINNLGRWGGGLHVIAPTIRLDSVTFEENVSDTQDGGGAHLAGRDIELTDVVAERNTGVVGSALYISPYLSDLSAVDIWDSSFSDNHATSNSTVRIALNAGSVARIENSQFRSNTSAGCSGLYVAGRTEIRDTTFADNVSGIGGALQFAPAGALTLERVDFERNTGAALLTSHEVQASLTECTFSDNTSGQGAAGIQVGYGNPNVTGGSLSVVNSSFLRNENTNPGLSGGAVFLVSNSSFGPLDATFEGVTFTGNSAEGPGGAMGAGDHVSLTLDSVIFASNQSLSGRGSAVSLNPAFARGPALSIEGTCQFDDNTPDDIWTSAQGPIDYANQTSCTGLTGCQP